jgi:hypothetical protein
MAEDWRVKVDLHEEELGSVFVRWLRENSLEDELAERLRGRVVVSHDEDKYFLYANARDQADAAREVVDKFLDEHKVHADVVVQRWHEVAEQWEEGSLPLPETPEEIEAEHQRRVELERKESADAGMDEWEVQVTLPHHHPTKELADRLEHEGLKVSRRWRHLVIPVPSEDDGQELAERIRQEAPPDAQIAVAGSYGEVVANTPYSGFSLLGGLGN